jgi:hypothetical protein
LGYIKLGKLGSIIQLDLVQFSASAYNPALEAIYQSGKILGLPEPSKVDARIVVQ